LFVNEDEARALLGGAAGASAGDVANGLRERGAAAVVLTRGAGDVLVAAAGGIAEFPSRAPRRLTLPAPAMRLLRARSSVS